MVSATSTLSSQSMQKTAKLDLYDHFPNTDGAIYALRRQINKELVKIIFIFLACLRRFLLG